MKVNEQLAREWIAALRSGKYVQGQGGLQSRDHEFCCLGVYCEVLSITPKYHDNTKWYWYDKEVTRPSLEHMRQLMPDATDQEITIFADTCVQMNDLVRYSFDKIADELEKMLLGEQS